MKQYQIVFNVPDNFVPEELSLNATYNIAEDAGQMSIAEEGFVDDIQEISLTPELEKLLKDNIAVVKDGSNEHDVVRIMFSGESNIDVESLQAMMKACEIVYQCPCICLSSDVDVLVENADEAIKMLNGMIAKVKTRAAVKDTSGIILPN